MINTKNVGKTIATLRQNKGMTQQALAASLNVTHQAVSRWENGITMPDMQTMLDMSHLFGVTIEQILNGDAADADKPGFGKKLLNMLSGIINEPEAAANADIAEETEAVEDEKEAEEEGGEPDFEEEDAGEQNKEEPKSAFDLGRILRIAPFMSKEALDNIVLKCADRADWDTITSLAPFVSRDALRSVVNAAMNGKKADRRVILKLAPFLGSDLLAELLSKNSEVLDWSTLSALAPFLGKDVVDRLATVLSDMPSADTKEEKKPSVTFESVMGDVGKTLNDIGSSIGNTLGSSFNTITNAVENAMKTLGVTSPKAQPTEEEKPQTSERRRSALEMIVGKALEDNNIDWIKQYVTEIGNPDLLNRIAEAALKAEDRDLFTDTMDTLGRDEADIAAALAIKYQKADWLEDTLAYVTDPAILNRYAEAALESNNMELFTDAVVNMSDEAREAICEKAQEKNNVEALEELLAYGCSDAVLLYAVKNSMMDLTEAAAQDAGDDALTAALEIAISSSDWPIINLLTEFMD